MKKQIAFLAFSWGLFGLSMPASATMINLGNDLFYDSTQDITWYDHLFEQPLRDDTFKTGAMNMYNAAEKMVSNLEYMGLTNWRIPTFQEWSLTDEEFGPWPLVDFTNISPERAASTVFSWKRDYLSSTIVHGADLGYSDWPIIYATHYGEVGPSSWYQVVAVTDGRAIVSGDHSGEAPPVPEPATMLLTGIGLAGAGLSSLRRKKKNA
jgi:hypothetical protein